MFEPRFVESSGASLHGVGVGGRCTRRDDPSSLHATTSRSASRHLTQARSTPGPTSPTSCTSSMSRGATTSRPAPNPTATNPTRSCAARRCVRPRTPDIWNPLPYFDTVEERPSARQHPIRRRTSTPPREPARCRRCRGSCRPGRQRAPAGPDERRQSYVTSLVNAVMQRPRLGLDRDLLGLGRLGRLLRPRRPAHGRRERLRPTRSRPS